MCTYSMVADFYRDKWAPMPWYPGVIQQPSILPRIIPPEEFDRLKQDVLDLKELLKRAKAYDEKNGEPHCETDAKTFAMNQVAKAVDVTL